MTYKSKVWNKISAIISIIFGVLYSITLIGLPVAMFFFIAYRRFSAWSEISDASLIGFKEVFLKWAIFLSIFAFPIGLISLVPLMYISNNAKVSSKENPSSFTFSPEPEIKVSTEEVVQENEKRETSTNTLTDEETIAKLKDLLDLGLITKEEYERAKSEVIKKG